MLSFKGKNLIVGFTRMFAALEGVFIDNNGIFLNLAYLLIHLYYAVLGETIHTLDTQDYYYSISLRIMLISVLRY